MTSLPGQQVLDLPVRALTPICFFNHALNSPSNLFFPYTQVSHGRRVKPPVAAPDWVPCTKIFKSFNSYAFFIQNLRINGSALPVPESRQTGFR